nr:THO complex subunit 4A-like [Ipomoea trifida]
MFAEALAVPGNSQPPVIKRFPIVPGQMLRECRLTQFMWDFKIHWILGKTLFSEIGHLQNFGIHYDRTGRSMGTGEVVFFRRSDAMAAMRTFHNVPLDGRPIKIDEVGVHVEIAPAPVPLPRLFLGSLPITPFQFVPPPNLSGYEEGESSRLPRAGGSGSRAQDPQFRPHGHEGWRDRSHHRHATTAELDVDLDRYHSDAKKQA